jgi:hypothetical protein
VSDHKENDICANCGYMLALHVAANLTDGAFVGQYLTLCPTALFLSSTQDSRNSLPALPAQPKSETHMPSDAVSRYHASFHGAFCPMCRAACDREVKAGIRTWLSMQGRKGGKATARQRQSRAEQERGLAQPKGDNRG